MVTHVVVGTPAPVHVRQVCGRRGRAARAEGIQGVITVTQVQETVPPALLTEVVVGGGGAPTPFGQ